MEEPQKSDKTENNPSQSQNVDLVLGVTSGAAAGAAVATVLGPLAVWLGASAMAGNPAIAVGAVVVGSVAGWFAESRNKDSEEADVETED